MSAQRSHDELAFLSAHDDDPFSRYEAMQQLMINVLLDHIAGGPLESAPVIEAVGRTIADKTLDRAFIAEAVRLPSEAYQGDQMSLVDPDAIHAARDALQGEIGRALESEWRALHHDNARTASRFRRMRGRRGGCAAWRSTISSLRARADGPAIAFDQFDSADNMTERQMGARHSRQRPQRAARRRAGGRSTSAMRAMP